MDWEKGNQIQGRLPAIIQDARTKRVLMLGYMTLESYQKTLDTGEVTFYSRSKKRLWKKGEISGNALNVVGVEKDCDEDALLIQVQPQGPTCHRQTLSCFEEGKFPTQEGDWSFLGDLEATIQQRIDTRPEGSYVGKLLERGIDRIAQKVGEEAVETVIAAKNNDLTALESEAADLVFHLAVLLKAKKSSLHNVIEVLKRRQSRD